MRLFRHRAPGGALVRIPRPVLDGHASVHPSLQSGDRPRVGSPDQLGQFKAIAQKFSELAGKHLGVRKDMVATALLHDTPGEIGQPFGEVRDWRRGDAEPVPGKTMFNLKVVERPYPDIYKMYSALGPNVAKPGGVGAKGVSWSCAPEYEQLKARLGVVSEPGVSEGMPRIDNCQGRL